MELSTIKAWTCNKKLDKKLRDYATSFWYFICCSNSAIDFSPKVECNRFLLYQVSIHLNIDNSA